MTTKYERNSCQNKFGTFSFRHEIEHQKKVKSSCECKSECDDNLEKEVCISEIYENNVDIIPLKSELEPKMKTIVNIVLNKQRLNKIINKKEW